MRKLDKFYPKEKGYCIVIPFSGRADAERVANKLKWAYGIVKGDIDT